MGDEKKAICIKYKEGEATRESPLLLYNKTMNDESLRTLHFLLLRLERISADSVVAHHASGVRGAMLRVVDTLEKRRRASDAEVRRLIENGYALLEKAAEEKVR